jgi:hypothetical protein
MKQSKHIFVQLIGLSLTLFQLWFWAFWLFRPKDIMEGQELSTITAVYWFIGGAAGLYLLIGTLWWKNRGSYAIMEVIGACLVTIMNGILFFTLVGFTGQFWDAPINQIAWFARYNGVIIGAMLAVDVWYSAVILTGVIVNYSNQTPESRLMHVSGLAAAFAVQILLIYSIIPTMGFWVGLLCQWILSAFVAIITFIAFIRAGKLKENANDAVINPIIPREHFPKDIKIHLRWFFSGIFQLGRLYVLAIALGTIGYMFSPEIYIFSFQRQVWLSALFGIGIAVALRRSPKALIGFYFLIATSVLGFSFLLNADVLQNGFSFYSSDYDIIFPFHILLGPWHAALAGLFIGFILTFELSKLFEHYEIWATPTVRALITVCLFVGLGYALQEFGGRNAFGGGIGENQYMDNWKPYNINPFLQGPIDQLFYYTAGLIGLLILFHMILPGIRVLFHKLLVAKLPPLEHRKSVSHKLITFLAMFGTLMPTPGVNVKGDAGRTLSRATVRRGILACSLMAILGFSSLLILGLSSPVQNAYRLPAVSRKNGVNVYAAPSYVRIGPQQKIFPESAISIEDYTMSLARNEYESMQLVIDSPLRSLNGFRYSITNFTTLSGLETIPSWSVTVRYAEPVIDGQYFDKLVPFWQTNFVGDRNHVLWITVYAPYSATAGKYSGTLNFTFGDNEFFTFNISLEIWNFTVPWRRHIRSNFGGQSINPQAIQSYAAHRINSYGIPINWAPSYELLNAVPEYTCWLNASSNRWIFNWTWWDAQIETLLSYGTNAFWINTPLGMPREPIWFEDDGITYSEWGIRFGTFLEGVNAHLKQKLLNESKDWYQYSYIYFIDEFQMFIPEGYEREEYFNLLEGFLALINASAPEIPIMTTTPPSRELQNIRKYIDIYCPITSDYDPVEWQAAQTEGKEMWMYPCVGPRAPWPNSHLYNRLYEIRVLYWQAYLYGLDGFLYWSAQAYYHGRYGLGYNAWGDGWFMYEDRSGNIYDSIRWENWRDANEDFEYLWLMNRTITELGIPSEDRTLFDHLLTGVTGIKYTYCDSGTTVVAHRNQIGAWLNAKQTAGTLDLIALAESA